LPYFPKRLENGDYILTVYPEMNTKDCKNPEKFLQHFYDCLESHVLRIKNNTMGFIVVLKNKTLKSIHMSINRTMTEYDIPITL
jgi:hypothetical protein